MINLNVAMCYYVMKTAFMKFVISEPCGLNQV